MKSDFAENELPCCPSKWPQRPLMIRATPGSSTKIHGIRYSQDSSLRPCSDFANGVLPINNGQEVAGHCIITSFESQYFRGDLLIRINNAPRVVGEQYKETSYFDNKKRTFQAVVRGKFKERLAMNQCVTGQTFRRRGLLPSRWIVSSFLKIVSLLAPQLQISLDGEKPRFLAPLCSTAQTISVERKKSNNGANIMDSDLVEPDASNEASILWQSEMQKSKLGCVGQPRCSARCVKDRKNYFNRIYGRKDGPFFSTNDTYVFEFYQHMLDFGDDISVKMGKPIGNVSVSQITNGQPIKFMSAYNDEQKEALEILWSFDIWHEAIYDAAESIYSREQ